MALVSSDKGYVPLNGCGSCGRDFTSLDAFDIHRVGTHEPMTRRCMSDDELVEAGLARVLPGDSVRYDSRIASGVPLYWNPEHVESVRAAFA